jgi:DNA-binding transcriptional ArsR family regulator
VTAQATTRPALRALRHEPWFVDDSTAERSLASARVPAESARLARAWLVCWQAALVADDRYGRVEPWAIDLSVGEIAVPRGAGDAERRDELLRALCDARLATVVEAEGDVESQSSSVATLDRRLGHPGEGRTTRATLARGAFAEHRAALALDWRALVGASDREPAVLLTARALAELLVPLDAFSAVPRRDLIERTGYQQKQVRVALRRLEAAEFLESESAVGATARYRFTARALGRQWTKPDAVSTEAASAASGPLRLSSNADSAGAAAASAAPARAAEAVDSSSDPAVGRPREVSPAAAQASGVSVTVGGVTLAVDSGAVLAIGAEFTATLSLGADGRPHLTIERRATP